MAKFKWNMGDYIETLKKLDTDTNGMIKAAVYEGAAVIADEIKASIPVDSGELKRSMGLSKITTKKGYTYTKVKFNGYDEKKKSSAFPRGVPNAVKAASLESGNSRGQKATHFISHAVKRAKSAAIQAMSKKFDEGIEKAMEK